MIVKQLVHRRRRILIACCHAGLAALSFSGAFGIAFEFSPPRALLPVLLAAVALAVPLKVALFHLGHLDGGCWTTDGPAEWRRAVWVNLAASASLATALGVGFPRLPAAVYCLDLLFSTVVLIGMRTGFRRYPSAPPGHAPAAHRKPVFIYGAGAAGEALLREIRANPRIPYEVAGFIDDDPDKQGERLLNTPVLGRGRQIPAIVGGLAVRGRCIDEIIIAMPSASGRRLQEAAGNCRAAGLTCKIVPGFEALLTGRVAAADIRDISIDDLLGRPPVQLEQSRIQRALAGRSVLITGGAGSIGSELAKQVAAFGPAALVIFDQAESDLFRIEMHLRARYPALRLVPVVGDICDAARLREVLRRYRVEALFHAAAYKHVPMMEANALEALRNNVLGTWNVLRAAEAGGVSSLLLISSDKAVNPQSVMGATKRAAECIVTARQGAAGPPLKCVSVRFGNVLGSNGSVVPLFQQQIAAGGPVTVTHPDVRRYFMTIREAVQLILQASTMGHGGEIFVLEMGEPVRILDLARQMIRLSRMTPEEDIEIRIVGMRPGEKLNEELTGDGERTLPTYHEKIRIVEGPQADAHGVEAAVGRLRDAIERRDEAMALERLRELVPEFRAVHAMAATA